MHSVPAEAVQGSLTHQSLGGIKVFQKVLALKAFDARIDTPSLDKASLRHDLSAVIVPLSAAHEETAVAGLLRIFKSGPITLAGPLLDKVHSISSQVEGFVSRISELRKSLRTLRAQTEACRSTVHDVEL